MLAHGQVKIHHRLPDPLPAHGAAGIHIARLKRGLNADDKLRMDRVISLVSFIAFSV